MAKFSARLCSMLQIQTHIRPYTVLLHCIIIVSISELNGKLVRTPRNTLAKVGESITLECVTSDEHPQIEWRHYPPRSSEANPNRLYTGGEVTDVYKTKISLRRRTRGEISLTITKLVLEDSGTYECVDESDDVSEKADLVILGVKLTL